MFTVVMAFIDAKYKAEFEIQYIGVVIVDLMVLLAITEIFGK